VYDDNDGRFPDDTPVLVWFPSPDADQHDRSTWSWIPGHVLGQCHTYPASSEDWTPEDEGEWHIVVDGDARLIQGHDGDGEPLYPACFRDASEIRLRD
jgi:hypothetical protein